MDEKTLETLREALRFSPDNAPLRKHLAQTLTRAERYEDAAREYSILAQNIDITATSDNETLFEWAEVLWHLRRYEEAAAKLFEIVGRDSQNADNAPAHLLMARVLVELRQNSKASRHYDLAVEADFSLRDLELETRLNAASASKPSNNFPSDEKRVPVRSQARDEFQGDDDDHEQVADEWTAEMERPHLRFEDVGGMSALKETIRVNIIYPFLHPEIYKAYGKKSGGGILLYGPPGCGKTYIARATAGECAARFLAVGIEDVLDMWLGQSESKLHSLFEAARRAAPSVLFFDELDALAGKRSASSSSTRSVVNQLLAETDGAKGNNENLLIMGATNSPWDVDAAFRRPGRFDKVLFVPPPDRAARLEILKLHCEGKPVADNLDFPKIAARTQHFSGADLAALCEASTEFALRETLKTGKMRQITTNDFMDALKTIKSTTQEWLQTARNYALYANQTGLYDPIAEYLSAKND